MRLELGRVIVLEEPAEADNLPDEETGIATASTLKKKKTKPAKRLVIPAELITKHVILYPDGISEEDV